MTTSPTIFSPGQKQLLMTVLNRIVPQEGKMPAAGDVGVADFVESAVAKDTRLRRLFGEGLAQIDIVAAAQEGREFQELAQASQEAVLRQVEKAQPQFFDALVLQTYNGYYTNPQVFQLINYVQSPEGEPTELLDTSLLEKQRQRAPFWRRV
ncbi:MAG: gluconate 2-dehydrogenase subunit 3 family protein [SAR202 cluster bacterium]|nr:gluconate 2-dehydrogenase subunit 3 family protein [SAR202 cluster bacterium]